MQPNQTKKILIVEDEAFIAEIYSRELQKSGYITEIAGDGPQALELLKSHPFDLMLLDILLPTMHGLELLKHWRQTNPESKMPVLLLTNLGQDEVIKEAFSLGAAGYLIKASYTPKQVVAEVQNIFSGNPTTPPPTAQQSQT